MRGDGSCRCRDGAIFFRSVHRVIECGTGRSGRSGPYAPRRALRGHRSYCRSRPFRGRSQRCQSNSHIQSGCRSHHCLRWGCRNRGSYGAARSSRGHYPSRFGIIKTYSSRARSRGPGNQSCHQTWGRARRMLRRLCGRPGLGY